jgi:hypothetical protein
METVDFTREFEVTLRACGLRLPDPLFEERVVAMGRIPDSVLDDAFRCAKNDSIPLVIVILPDRGAELFSRVKYLTDVKHGVHSLCIVPKPQRGRQSGNTEASYLTNLALKMNLKLGGLNHGLADSSLISDTMFLGIDVTHPSGNELKPDAPSIAGVVANLDEKLGQWPGSIRRQTRRQEMVQDLKDMVVERLSSWRGVRLPGRIVVYRDGVSESDYPRVLTEEYPQIKKAIAECWSWEPKLTLIIVGKRHHTR